MSDLKLKPCPFCGAKVELVRQIGKTDIYYIECTKCRALMGREHMEEDCSHRELHFENKEDLIREWNTRSNSNGN